MHSSIDYRLLRRLLWYLEGLDSTTFLGLPEFLQLNHCIGALTIRIGFWGILPYNHRREPPN